MLRLFFLVVRGKPFACYGCPRKTELIAPFRYQVVQVAQQRFRGWFWGEKHHIATLYYFIKNFDDAPIYAVFIYGLILLRVNEVINVKHVHHDILSTSLTK